jgi:hypothetical protein
MTPTATPNLSARPYGDRDRDRETVVLPNLSARSYSDRDREAVLALFTEPDFYFRTAQPDTRPEWEILDLLGEDTRVLLVVDEPVGLYALENEGSDHGCHYKLDLRLRAAAPPHWWHAAYREVARATRWRHEVVRFALRIGEFDQRGLVIVRSLGLTEEGVLADTTVHEGRRYGYVFFSQIWTPTS